MSTHHALLTTLLEYSRTLPTFDFQFQVLLFTVYKQLIFYSLLLYEVPREHTLQIQIQMQEEFWNLENRGQKAR